jgi:cell division protein FtsB
MTWMKILGYLNGGKSFIVKHWKIFVVLGVILAVSIFFIRKISGLKHEVDVLHEQIVTYQQQMARDRNDIVELNRLYSDTTRRQEELVMHYQEDMNNLTQQYNADMQKLRDDALGARTRNATRYSQSPDEGTRSVSQRFGIPIGN